MRLPSVIRLPNVGNYKRNKSSNRNVKTDSGKTASSISTSSSSTKVLSDVKSETSSSSDDSGHLANVAVEKTEEEKARIDFLELFGNETWNTDSLKLELGTTERKNWLDDVQITSNSRIEGVSAYEYSKPTFQPLHSTFFDRLDNLEKAATMRTSQVLATSE